MVKKNKSEGICLVTYPFSEKNPTPILLFKFIDIFHNITDKLYVITGNVPNESIPDPDICYFINFQMDKGLKRNIPIVLSFPIWVFNYLKGQFMMSYYLLKHSKNFEIVIFFLGYDYLTPIIVSRLLRKKTVMIVTTSSYSAAASHNYFLYQISRFIEQSCYMFSEQLIACMNFESEKLINMYELEKRRDKLFFGGGLPVDADLFKIKKKLTERKDIIGYVGRLSPEKGIVNFVEAITLLLEQKKDLEFLICGDGILYHDIVDILKKNGLCNKVKLTGWIERDMVSNYFNEIKILVVPSYTEGFPNAILEAMSTGTPIIASPVSSIPDIIKDGETGFLMEDNSPESITKNVIRALESNNLDEIVSNSFKLVKNGRYSYEEVVENYKKLLDIS